MSWISFLYLVQVHPRGMDCSLVPGCITFMSWDGHCGLMPALTKHEGEVRRSPGIFRVCVGATDAVSPFVAGLKARLQTPLDSGTP